MRQRYALAHLEIQGRDSKGESKAEEQCDGELLGEQSRYQH